MPKPLEQHDGPSEGPNRSDSSPPELQSFVDQVLTTCGLGRVLHVNCGLGRLVRMLLVQGVDAWGVDSSPGAVGEANKLAPGRYQAGSVLKLPYEPESFDTIISTACLEDLAEADIPPALSELHRVTKRFLYIRLTGNGDGGRRITPNGRDRAWWESRFFEAEFRRHPLLLTAVGFESLENGVGQITLLFEKIPPAAVERFPLKLLRADRDLHMDMLRETGRRSDAHIARYDLAKGYIRPNDVVLDLACGLGYGSAILWDGSEAARVVGLDVDGFAVKYAQANFGPLRPTLEFGKGDVCDLSAFGDASVDMIVAFETIEHLETPERFLKEARRILKPGGRFICSVPNRWVDDAGQDPNPHHRQVFDLTRLKALVGAHLLVEQVFAQTAGGGMMLTDRPRRLVEVPAGAQSSDQEAEWWLLVGMKDPVGATKENYVETAFGTGLKEEPNITAFARDYHNPWLVRSMVTIGQRCRSSSVLRDLTRRVLATAPRGSADVGAALCVSAYLELESGPRSPREREQLIGQLRNYIDTAEHTPHAARWKISNQYVLAKLLLVAGKTEPAREEFWKCAQMDCLVFSPLLATKTVDAAFWAGWLDAVNGRWPAARAAWKHGVNDARRVLGGSWTEVEGNPERPVLFGLREATAVLDAATRCANGLSTLDQLPLRPGHSAAQILYSLTSELRRREAVIAAEKLWATSLREGNAWLERQNVELRSWIQELDRARTWLEEQRSSWIHTAEEREKLSQEQRNWSQTLERAKNWLDQQVASWRSIAEKRDKIIEEQRAWMTSLEHGKSWLEQDRDRWRKLAEERSVALQENRQDLDELQGNLNQRERQLADLRAAVKEQEATTAEQRRSIEQLEHVVADLQRQRVVLQEKIERRDARVRDVEKRFLYRALAWLKLLPPFPEDGEKPE
jgi:SAM-dependent methyltransferase